MPIPIVGATFEVGRHEHDIEAHLESELAQTIARIGSPCDADNHLRVISPSVEGRAAAYRCASNSRLGPEPEYDSSSYERISPNHLFM